MNQLSLSDMQRTQGGQVNSRITPNWVDCSVLTGAAVATCIWGTPVLGMMVGGMAAGCWNKVR